MKKTYANLLRVVLILCAITLASCVEDETPPQVPKKPGILQPEAISSTSIRVSWVDSSDNEDGFFIERARLDSFYFQTIAAVEPNVASYLDTGLVPLTSYAYRVKAYNGAGNSKLSSIRVETTPRTALPPNVPFSLKGIVFGPSNVLLSWFDNSSDEIGFRIERATNGSNSFFGIDTVAANINSYEDNELVAGNSYQYRVRAYNNIGGSEYTSIVSVTPGNTLTAPNAPTVLTAASVSATQIGLAWNDNSANESSFIVERAQLGSGVFSVIATLTTGTTSYRDKNLPPSTGFTYRVRAHNSVGDSPFSNTADAVTMTLSGIPVAPSALVGAPKSATQIWLDWEDNSDNEDGFYIERAVGGTGNFSVIQTVVANEIAYRATGLNSSTTYSFRIRAFNTNGTSGYSNVITRTTPPLQTAPGSPTTLQMLDYSSEKIKIKWKGDNVTNEDGFQVERRAGRTGNFVQIATVGVNETEFEDFEVLPATEYSYRVRAYNLLGTSNYTNILIVKTKARTETRFINGSTHSIISLVIDGVQYFTAPQEISAGSYLPIPMSSGRHTYSMKNGYWNGLYPVILYSDTGQFIQQLDVSGSVSFTDPTIYQILTKFKNLANWQATYVAHRDSLGNPDSTGTMRFQFFADGTYFFYQNGAQGKSGLFSLKQYNSNLSITFTTEKGDAVLNEDPQNTYFTMRNGPPGQEVLTYYYLPSQ